jgi:hypothetical protein
VGRICSLVGRIYSMIRIWQGGYTIYR